MGFQTRFHFQFWVLSRHVWTRIWFEQVDINGTEPLKTDYSKELSNCNECCASFTVNQAQELIANIIIDRRGFLRGPGQRKQDERLKHEYCYLALIQCETKVEEILHFE
ncbi:hypothetical protein SLA2020_427290 [Shorea laevis]